MGKLRKFCAASLLGLTAGCSIDNSFLESLGIPPPSFERPETLENPLLIALPKEEKGKVFEAVFHVLDNYGFDILESNRNDGRIETATRIAPGVGLFLKPGSPDYRERLLATLQTYRHRVTVLVQDAKQGGIFIDVHVRKELEIIDRPQKQTVGPAIFRVDNDIERHFEIIDETTYESSWLYRGRDHAMEQELIRRIKAVF
jgi:hypothetical protein